MSNCRMLTDSQTGKVLQDFDVHEELDRQSARDKPMMVRCTRGCMQVRHSGKLTSADGHGMAKRWPATGPGAA